MSESNSNSSDARRKIHRSGALARVLGEVGEASSGPAAEPIAGAQIPSRPPVRYFPTKGFARVEAKVCRPWRLADRPSDEFGHIDALTKSLVSNGQVQPALVKVCNDPAAPEIKYEVIAGVARWRSALAAGLELDVQIRALDDVQAYRAMIAENEDRQNLSDYARATRFARALSEKLVSDQDELASMAGMSKSQMSYFIGFAGLPSHVAKVFADIRAIPVRLGYSLSVAVKKGFENEIIRDISLIESGEISRDQIPSVWSEREGATKVLGSDGENPVINDSIIPSASEYRNVKGDTVFLVRRANSGALTLKFSKAISIELTENELREIATFVDKIAGR